MMFAVDIQRAADASIYLLYSSSICASAQQLVLSRGPKSLLQRRRQWMTAERSEQDRFIYLEIDNAPTRGQTVYKRM